jgi:lysophospholipase L1-like esterase
VHLKFGKFAALLVLMFVGSASALADAPVAPAATAPTTAPARVPLTPEQRAIIAADAKVDAAAPAVKLDLAPTLKGGVPNPDFGKPSAGFIKQHESFLARGKQGPIGVLFLGDSITAGWAGRGIKVWHERYDKYQPANFGIGGDRTQHVLWRIDNGELDGISPKVVVLMIGTNNTGQWSADDILRGDTKIVEEINQKLPDTKVLLLAIFPRGADPKNKAVAAVREKITTVNEGLAKLDDGNKTRYLDIGAKFLDADGTLPKSIMPDALHPNEKGYVIWADAIGPLLDEMMK